MTASPASPEVRPAEARFSGFGWRPLGRRLPVVEGLDLVVEPGERVLLAGPSGAGKSTLLHALVGALGETMAGDLAGTVAVDGRVGLVTQNPGDSLVAARLGRDIAFGPENLGLGREEIWRRVDAARAAVGLPYGRDHPTDALSGGEVQRLALAGALASTPGLLLLDEPTSMLDEDSAAAVRTAVAEVVATTGCTLLVVEHRIERWLDLVDRVVVLGDDGAVLADTDPGDFAARFTADLGARGVWMPGLAAPVPVPVEPVLVAPVEAPRDLRAREIDVTLTRRSVRGSTVAHALRSVDAVLGAGRSHALVGPSGAGKSTLLAVLAGLQAPTAGSVTGHEVPPHRQRTRHLAAWSGWVPQQPEHGLLGATVAQEVALTAERLGRPVDVEAVLAHFGLGALAGANPYRLSGGEQRRLALAAALAHRPAAVFLDEPTVGQDRLTWAAVTGWLLGAASAGALAATATHDLDLVALVDEVLHLRQGART